MAKKSLPSGAPVTRLGQDDPTVKIGDWYWVTHNDTSSGKNVTKRSLACVTEVGTNYALFQFVGERYAGSIRIHFDAFDKWCEREPAYDDVIRREVEKGQRETLALLEQVKDVTARLALGSHQSETEALVVSSGAAPIKDYKAALIKAKDVSLPELFKKIKLANEHTALWMQAQLAPFEALARGMKPVIEKIEGRILNVELYAGLCEEVVQVRDGDPAAKDEPIHLLQRRAYMDEECLLDYKHGGMEFKDLRSFDRWMAKVKNADRLLPHPRCVLAMRVRRFEKERNGGDSLSAYIRFVLERDLDKLTFLYIRNGHRIYRLNTSIEFGHELFPDPKTLSFTEPMMALVKGGDVEDLLTESDFKIKVARELAARKDHEQKVKTWRAKVKDLVARGIKHGADEWPADVGWFGPDRDFSRFDFESYTPYAPSSVYYDDVTEHIAKQTEAHNRLVLVLQGLLDRSEVFHPHPPWRLWDVEGFTNGLRLVYDESRAIVEGEAPDFERYRARLNRQLRRECLTVGQQDFWLRREAEKENARQAANWRITRASEHTRFKPYGDPGPGMISQVSRVVHGKEGARCVYHWKRSPKSFRRYGREQIGCYLFVPVGDVLNVSAYVSGDFLKFFNDPRTRASYLKWAPLMLEAEEYHAGNRKVGGQDEAD
jgi:hypothetical protein